MKSKLFLLTATVIVLAFSNQKTIHSERIYLLDGITGVVIYNGTPQAYKTVSISLEGMPIANTTTNASGYFNFPDYYLVEDTTYNIYTHWCIGYDLYSAAELCFYNGEPTTQDLNISRTRNGCVD